MHHIITYIILLMSSINNQEFGFKNKVLHTIESNISNPNLTIKDLCRSVNLERTQLYRKAKTTFGISPSQLIIEKRMERAKLILENKELSIREVASRCGYSELSYFDRVFYQNNNMTPSSYRKSNKV